MKIKGKLIIMLVIIVVLFSLGSVAANDVSNTNDLNTNYSQENIKTNDSLSTNPSGVLIDEQNTSLGVNEIKNFTYLQNDINNATGEVFNLTYNVEFQTGDPTQININKNMLFNGNGYKIDAKDSAMIFNINNLVTDFTITNTTLTNGKAPTYSSAAICSKNSANITVRDCSFSNMTNASVIVYAYGGSLSVVGCNFTNSIVRAIYTNNCNACNVSDCSFSNITNVTGVVYAYGGSLSVVGCNFTDFEDVAIRTRFCVSNVIGCSFSNMANDYGVVYAHDGGSVSVVGCNFTDSKATAIYTASNCVCNVRGCSFSNMTTSAGVVHALSGSNVSVFGCNFSDSKATAIYLTKGNAIVNNTNFAAGEIIKVDKNSKLNLENISTDENAFITNYGTILSPVIVNVLGNQTVSVRMGKNLTVFANVTADGILVKENTLKFTINGTKYPATWNSTTNCFEVIYLVDFIGEVPVTANYKGANNSTVKTAIIKGEVANNFSYLQNDINAAGKGFDLTYDVIWQTGDPTQININKNILIRGNGHKIDANNSAMIFNINNGVTDFTIINTTLTNANAPAYLSAAIFSQNGANITVRDCSFSNMSSEEGKAIIYANGGNVRVIDCNFTNSEGIAIYTHNACVSNVSGCSFSNLTATSGAVYVNGGSVGVVNCNFTNSKGIAIYLESCVSNVSDCSFSNLTAASSYGVVDIWNSNVKVVNCNFTDSNATAIHTLGVSVCNVGACSFSNLSILNYGLIYASMGSNVSVLCCNFTNSNATAIYINKCMCNVNACNFYNLTTASSVVYANAGNSTVVNSTFIGNHKMTGVTDVYQDCVLTVLANNQSLITIAPNENFNLTAKLVDNKGNNYYSAGLTYMFTDEEGIVKTVSAGELFNATTNLTNSGSYNVNGNYTDPYGDISSYILNNVTVHVYKAVLIGEDLIKYYKGDEKYTIYLKLTNGTPLAGETVAITINGETYDLVTDNNGRISLPIGLRAGNYLVSSVYNGSYGIATLENNITVKTTIQGSETELYYRNGTSYNVCVIDSQGKIVTSGKVRFNIHGVFYDMDINNGTASLPIGLNAGTYIITAINPTNGEMTSNNITVLSTLVSEDVTLYYRNGSDYSVKVLDGQGDVVKCGNVRMNINGVFYDVKTDVNGIATLPIGLNPGNYIVTVINPVNGEMTSNNITVLSTLIGKDVALYYLDGTSYKVKVLDGQGNPLYNTNVTMNINGIFYTRTTGLDGVASLPITLLPGQYIVTTTYNEAATSNTITVLPRG